MGIFSGSDATVDVRWDYGRQVGLDGYNQALDVKAHVKEVSERDRGFSFLLSAKHALISVPQLEQFAERYLTPTSDTTCSESLFVYPNSDGSSPNYRTIFPTFPRPAFGWGPQTTCIYADSPEITIPSACKLATLHERLELTGPRELCSRPGSVQLDR